MDSKGGVKREKRSQVDNALSGNLILEVTSDPLTISYNDTIRINEGVSDTFKIYQLLVGFDWSVKAKIIGDDGFVTHGSVSAPIKVTTSGEDTVRLCLSSLASYFRIGFNTPNGGRRSVLFVDGVPKDTAYMTTIGEFVELSDPRMEASIDGVFHKIELYVFGDLLGYIDTLLYFGDTTIIAESGVEFQAPLNLRYIGPGSEASSDFDFKVQIGITGRIIFDAKLEKPRIVYLEHKEGPKYIYSDNWGVAVELSVLEDGFTKYLDNIKFESNRNDLYAVCDRAFLVHAGDTLSQIELTEETGEFISFRNVNTPFRDECELELVLHVKREVSETSTVRFKCIRINGRTNNGINVSGYFNGEIESPWSEVCNLGN